MMGYLRRNVGRAFQTSPFRATGRAWLPLPLFMAFAAAVGFASGLFRWAPLHAPVAHLLPFTLFVFPSLIEEVFFRGVLIPRDVLDRGRGHAAAAVGWSTLAFVVWHPLNALTVNPSANPLFLDPAFLSITAALGVACGAAYVLSRSIWLPVLIHWAAVVAWVLAFGGRNLLLEAAGTR
jgi:uncharacterized protein